MKINKRYIRQTTLLNVGKKGQQLLFNASVLIIGCGGLGNYVATSLAASGIGHIHLIDFDIINISNLHRQVFYKISDIGKSKSKVLAQYIQSINNDIKIEFSNLKLLKSNSRKLISKFGYIVDCTDNLHTKYLINDACVLENKALIYGSLHKFEAHVSSFNIQNKTSERNANLRDIFPKIPSENIPTCSEVGTLNPIVGIAALTQSNEVLKLILKIGEPLKNKMLIINSLDNSQMKLNLKINTDLNFNKIWEENTYSEEICSLLNPNEIDLKEFNKIKNDYRIINVSENEKINIKNMLHIPFSEFDIETIDLEMGKYIIICNKGKTSMAVVLMLQSKYPSSIFYSLSGGFSVLKQII